MSALAELQQWYIARCNGEWELEHGIKIETIDNPGWKLQVDLIGTPLATRLYSPFQWGETHLRWVECQVENGKWEGIGGPEMLEPLARIFLDWANSPK